MKLSEQEMVMVEVLRGWSEHREIKFSASFENGVWECELTFTPHPAPYRTSARIYPRRDSTSPVFVDRGVGTTFIEITILTETTLSLCLPTQTECKKPTCENPANARVVIEIPGLRRSPASSVLHPAALSR
jgi:hypothetical protein